MHQAGRRSRNAGQIAGLPCAVASSVSKNILLTLPYPAPADATVALYLLMQWTCYDVLDPFEANERAVGTLADGFEVS